MRSLITGADGFAGSHLAEFLVGQGHEVVAIVHDPANIENLVQVLSHIHIEGADIRDGGRVFQILRAIRPQRIYHLAAASSPAGSFADPRLTYEVNFGGTLNFLCAWQRLEFDCRFLYVSSADVYGVVANEQLPLTEEAAISPLSPYAGSKAVGELLSRQFFQSYGLPTVRVRPFNHTGPRQSESFVCSSFAKQIAEFAAGLGTNEVVVGNLSVSRDFSDVRDIVRGYHLLLEKGEPGQVYQLCSGCAVSIGEILRILASLASKPVKTVVDESKVRGREAQAVWGDASKAKRAVGWRPQYPLATTLHDLAQYWDRVVRDQSYVISRVPG